MEYGNNLASWRYQVYFQQKGLVPKDIQADILAILGDNAPALSALQKRAAELRRSETLEVDPSSGCAAAAITQENSNRFYHMVMDNRQLTINQIYSSIIMSYEC